MTLRRGQFERTGRLIAREMERFAPASWLAVHIGQHNYPEGLDPLIEHRGIDARDYLAKLRAAMAAEAAKLPGHEAYIAGLTGAAVAA